MASNPMGPGKLRGWVDFIAGIPVATKFKGAVTVLGALGVTGATTTGQITATQPATGTTTAKVVGIAGSTVNLLEVDASAITNAQKVVVDKDGHLAISQAAVPTGVAGTGAGTGPTIALTGTDQAGSLSVTTGTAPAGANAIVVTVGFKTAMAAAPLAVVLWPTSGNSAPLSGATQVLTTSKTTTGWVLKSGSTALTAGTIYTWDYVCL